LISSKLAYGPSEPQQSSACDATAHAGVAVMKSFYPMPAGTSVWADHIGLECQGPSGGWLIEMGCWAPAESAVCQRGGWSSSHDRSIQLSCCSRLVFTRFQAVLPAMSVAAGQGVLPAGKRAATTGVVCIVCQAPPNGQLANVSAVHRLHPSHMSCSPPNATPWIWPCL
jgi:hypothetical protein